MKYPYNLELATTDIDTALVGFARRYRGGHVKNASTSGKAPATHYLVSFPIAEHMKAAFLAMDKARLQYTLTDRESGKVLDSVSIKVQRIVVESED